MHWSVGWTPTSVKLYYYLKQISKYLDPNMTSTNLVTLAETSCLISATNIWARFLIKELIRRRRFFTSIVDLYSGNTPFV